MWRRMLAESVVSINDWLVKSSGLNKTLTIIAIFGFASLGYYFLGLPGAFLGVLVAVGMIDEIFGKKRSKERAKQNVFCSHCGTKQLWTEGKFCKTCGSFLHK